MSRTVIINADDFGMHPSIDAAVLDLSARGIVTATSIMSLYPVIPDKLRRLRNQGTSLGLHIDFTSEAAQQRYATRWSLRSLIGATWGRRLSHARAKVMIQDQIDAFTSLAGLMPDFIDGHEHIHQFPVIREALIEVLDAASGERKPMLRYTRPAGWQGAKATIIDRLGAHHLHRLTQQSGYSCNHSFGGVYGLQHDAPLHHLWTRWLAALPDQGGLIMCHPAIDASCGAFRLHEYRYLASTQFADLLQVQDIATVPWPTSA